MKTLFTSGNWEIGESNIETIEVVSKDDSGYITDHICSLPSNGLSIHPECIKEAKANAALIAAAPRMIQALQMLKSAIEEGDPQKISDVLVNYGNYAIQKAINI